MSISLYLSIYLSIMYNLITGDQQFTKQQAAGTQVTTTLGHYHSYNNTHTYHTHTCMYYVCIYIYLYRPFIIRSEETSSSPTSRSPAQRSDVLVSYTHTYVCIYLYLSIYLYRCMHLSVSIYRYRSVMIRPEETSNAPSSRQSYMSLLLGFPSG